MGEITPQLRVGDRERRVVDERLLAAVGDGVLTLHEYDERSALLWQARTRDELDALVADLPGAVPAPVATPAPDGPVRPQRVLAVMSEDRFAGALVPGQAVTGYAVMGKAVVDLRRDDLPDGTRVQVRSIMGEVEVQVPAGSIVHLSGLSLMGERKVTVDQGSGPVVHVDAVAVMGSVRVTQGDGTVVRSDGRSRAVPPPRPSSVAVPRAGHGSGQVARHGSGLGRLLGRAKGLVVPAVVVGALFLAGPDSTSIFGDSTLQVERGDDVQVSTLFGELQVVVPDDARVVSKGVQIFDGLDCPTACDPARGGDTIDVRRFGVFGGIEVLTKTEFAEQQAAERAEDAREDRQERLEEQREDAEDERDDAEEE